jgi:hypothetical protein
MSDIKRVVGDHDKFHADEAGLAAGESVIKCPSSLNMLKDTYDHSCY